MPTYEYQCLKCGRVFEVFQKMSDDPLVECDKCRGSLRKLFSPGGGIIFKGSGFYATDYKRGKPAKDSSGGGEGASEKKDSSGNENQGKKTEEKK